VWRLKPEHEDENDTHGSYIAEPVELEIIKARNGPRGKVKLTFLKSYTRFESAAKIDNDQPRGPHANE